MPLRRTAGAVLWSMFACFVAPVSAQSDVRYISDEIAITLREDKGMTAPVAALLKSGTRVQLLSVDAASGYAKVRVASGRDGWVLARYLSEEPAARERILALQSELSGQQAQVRKLEAENKRLGELASRARATSAPVAPIDLPRESSPPPESAPSPETDPVMMATGAGLFIAGLLTGVLVPLIQRSRPRRRPGAAR